jgi:uncharacterized membrane protein
MVRKIIWYVDISLVIVGIFCILFGVFGYMTKLSISSAGGCIIIGGVIDLFVFVPAIIRDRPKSNVIRKENA